jgi:hypothetical protein
MITPNGNSMVGTNSVVAATKEQVASDLAGEVILLSLQTGQYYGLDQVGARIWELVQRPTRVADIRDAIVREYEVDLEQCEHDVLVLVRELVTEGLIEVKDASELA